MTREDYERLGPPPCRLIPEDVRVFRGIAIQAGHIGDEDDVCVRIIFRAQGQEMSTMATLDKPVLDGLIRDLICARNKRWPTP